MTLMRASGKVGPTRRRSPLHIDSPVVKNRPGIGKQGVLYFSRSLLLPESMWRFA
jgi:hypothetical protein